MATQLKPEATTSRPYPNVMDMEDPLDNLDGVVGIMWDMAIAADDSSGDPAAFRFLAKTLGRIHKDLKKTWEECLQENRGVSA